jgi:hypothetical protein
MCLHTGSGTGSFFLLLLRHFVSLLAQSVKTETPPKLLLSSF